MAWSWRPQFHPAAPPVCYENDRMLLNRPVTPGSYLPGPFHLPLSPHTDLPRDSRVRAQWTEVPPEQQFQTSGMLQQPPPHGLQPQPPTRAWYAPPPSPNFNANWSQPNGANQSQSFTVTVGPHLPHPHPPHLHQHVWSPTIPQPLLEPYHMGPQWLEQPTCERGNMEHNMVPANPSPLLPPYPHPLLGDRPPSVTLHSGRPLVDPFIADWLRIVGSSKAQRSHQQSSTKIPEVRSLLCRALELLATLKLSLRQLATVPTDDATGWTEIMQKIDSDKEELQVLRSRLDSDGLVEHTARKLRNRKLKRERLKRKRRERELEREERRVKAEQLTSAWIERKRQEELKEKTEKSVQAAASGLLGEVKRKQSDIQYHLKLANALRDLRDSRRDASRKKGDAPPIEADECFSETWDHLSQMLTQQAVVYEEEEHALRVLMEEEVMEAMASSKSGGKGTKEAVAKPSDVLDPLTPSAPLTPSDPLAPFRDYYLQAETSAQALVSIRTEWDRYLSPEGTPAPLRLLDPPPPSTAQWAQYCVTENSEPKTPLL